ncbi:hypothetical protein V6N13_064234 [Hibiscus sabdariffa]
MCILGINAPTSQSFLNYVLLTVVYGSVMLYKRQPLKAKWYYYVVLGLVDVEANFLVVKAYQYTSITSVVLLDCWSIPCVMFLTFIFLKTKYRFRKIAGVVVCVAGLVMVVFSDVHAGDRSVTLAKEIYLFLLGQHSMPLVMSARLSLQCSTSIADLLSPSINPCLEFSFTVNYLLVEYRLRYFAESTLTEYTG